jgi:hypothetical protein
VDELDAMTPSPVLAPQVAVMRDWLGAASEPGTLYDDRPDAAQDAEAIAGQVCGDNGNGIGVNPGGLSTSTSTW